MEQIESLRDQWHAHGNPISLWQQVMKTVGRMNLIDEIRSRKMRVATRGQDSQAETFGTTGCFQSCAAQSDDQQRLPRQFPRWVVLSVFPYLFLLCPKQKWELAIESQDERKSMVSELSAVDALGVSKGDASGMDFLEGVALYSRARNLHPAEVRRSFQKRRTTIGVTSIDLSRHGQRFRLSMGHEEVNARCALVKLFETGIIHEGDQYSHSPRS